MYLLQDMKTIFIEDGLDENPGDVEIQIYLRGALWTLVWESEHFLYIIINSFYSKGDVYWCNILFLLWSDHTYSWLGLVFKFPQTLRSWKCKNREEEEQVVVLRCGGEGTEAGMGVRVKAPGPPSFRPYHPPVYTVTMIWDALCRKLESRRNRRETEVTTRGWGENIPECLVWCVWNNMFHFLSVGSSHRGCDNFYHVHVCQLGNSRTSSMCKSKCS